MEDDGLLEVKVLPPPIPLTTADDPEAVETLLRTMGPEHALVGVRGQGVPLAAWIGRVVVCVGCAPRHPPSSRRLAGRGTFATVLRSTVCPACARCFCGGALQRERLGVTCW
jgi:hypothetical protein